MVKMIDLDFFCEISYYSNFKTRNINSSELMESIFGPVPNNSVNIEDSLINENWPRFSSISNVNFDVNSRPVPRFLFNVNVKPTSVIKFFCDHQQPTWEHVNNIPPRPMTSITKGPEHAVTRNFTNSVQADMNFHCCLSPYCFSDHVNASGMGILIKGPWFTFAHTEMGGSASIVLLNKGIKNWCASTSSTSTRRFERCSHSRIGFKELMQRGPRERDARYLRFIIQRPGNLKYIPHLLAHAVLTVDTGSPRILSRWNAGTTSNQQLFPQTLHEYTFGVRCG